MTRPDDSDKDRGGADFGGAVSDGVSFSGADVRAADLGGVDLGRVWTSVAAEVWGRHPSPVERLAARLLRSPGLARALVTTPSLLLPWLMSTVAVFAVGGLLVIAESEPLVWLIAPAVSAIGVAYAYGPGVDPAWELACSTAVSQRMVLLVRAVAVFAVNAILGLAASALTSSAIATRQAAVGAAATAITFAWLLPMTAICALTLAVAVATRSATAGAATGVAAWLLTVLASRAASGQFESAVTNPASYLPYFAVAACATAVIAHATRPQRG